MSHSPASAIRTSWLIPTTMVAPGKSALMGGPVSFWVIHISGISTLILSMFASASVLMHIFDIPLPCFLSLRTNGLFRAIGDSKRSPWPVLGRRNRPDATTIRPDLQETAEEQENHDIASRFAMYLAFADFCWSCVHMSDHLYLATQQVFPVVETSQTFALLVCLFYGYQQMTHSVLALFTYFRVTRRTHIDLGSYDWRLHAICFGPIAIGVVIYGNLDAFGAFGYWCLSNANTTTGKLISFTVFALSLWTAVVTATSHYLIAIKIDTHLRLSEACRDGDLEGAVARFDPDLPSTKLFGSTHSPAPIRRLYGTPEHPPATPTSPRHAHHRDGKARQLTINTAALGIDSGGWLRPCGTGGQSHSPTTPPSASRPHQFAYRSQFGPPSPRTPPQSPHFPNSPTALISAAPCSPMSAPSLYASSCAAQQCKRWWVASQCLNNLIRAAVWVYIPMAIAAYVVATLHVMGYVEPVSSWFVAVLANATGLVNAFAYFKNEQLKARLRVPVDEVQRRVIIDVPERPRRG